MTRVQHMEARVVCSEYGTCSTGVAPEDYLLKLWKVKLCLGIVAVAINGSDTSGREGGAE